MKKLIYVMLAISMLMIFQSCNTKDNKEKNNGVGLFNDKEANDTKLVTKRIKQEIDIDGMGMIKDIKIESVEKSNDTTFIGVHSFFNPIFDKEVRITRKYYFTADLDSITNHEDIKSEMKSEGEWVNMDF